MNKTEQIFKKSIPEEGSIVIYGAGAYGRLMYRWLSDAGMQSRIIAFAVTSAAANEELVEGLPVRCIDSFRKEDVFVILAVNETIQKEMKENLEDIGLPWLAITQELLDSITSTHTPRREVFICVTYYHILCAIVYAVKNKGVKTDIVLGDILPEYQRLSANLVKSQIFANVYCFTPISEYKTDNFILKLFIHGRNARVVEQELTLDFSRYKRVYIFNDYTTLGRYLQDKGIHYTVLEDGCNFFQIVGDHFLGFLVPPKKTGLWYKIKRYLNYGYFFLGQSKYCDEIWVNKAQDLVIPLDKVIEKPMREMLNSITETEGKRIIKVFAGEEKTDILDDNYKDKVLILTQPFHKDGTVKSLAVQKKIYSDLVSDKLAEGKKVYIKVHPRDDTAYDDLNATILYKYMPIEIFSFNRRMYFAEVIAVSSTAVYNCDYAEKRTILGVDYIAKGLRTGREGTESDEIADI